TGQGAGGTPGAARRTLSPLAHSGRPLSTLDREVHPVAGKAEGTRRQVPAAAVVVRGDRRPVLYGLRFGYVVAPHSRTDRPGDRRRPAGRQSETAAGGHRLRDGRD